MSKISVIVPVYNVEKEIRKCLDSLLNQTYTNYEIILIDDGSTDSCSQICDEYAKREKKISVIHKENEGAGSARNAGLSVAKGEYIMFVDSDDWTDLNFISVAYNKIKETQADLLMFGIKTVEINDNTGKTIKIKKWTQDFRLIEGKENCQEAFCELLFSTLLQSLYNKIYKMSIIKKNNIRFPDIRRTQDAIFNMEYYKYIEKFVLIPDILYFYKFEGKSIFNKFLKDSYKTNIYYDNYLVNLLKSWRKYSGKQRIRVDEIYMITMFRTFGFCRNPKWEMNIKKRIEYIQNIVEEEYNINRIKDIVTENKEIKKMVKLVKNKRYKKIYFYLLTQTVYDENSNINKALKTINKPIKKIKMTKRIIEHTANFIQKNSRKIINALNIKRLKNKDFSLISSNCTGGLILHDLNLKFLSPTINLFFFAEDFIKFVEKLDYYIKQEIVFVDEKDYDYPIGILDDIKIHFMHYENEEEVKSIWKKRCGRINLDNLFIMMTDRDGCTEDIIDRFNKLPYKNKVIFTNKKYEQYPASFYIKGFENIENVGQLNEFSNLFGKKYYDQFDYVNWFNNNQEGGERN